MSQAEFGKRGGVTKLTQLRYEKSERSPPIRYWQALHELGVDILYVITGETRNHEVIDALRSSAHPTFKNRKNRRMR